MTTYFRNASSLVTMVRVPSGKKERFAEWQADFHTKISSFPGFVSLEIISPNSSDGVWKFIQRFSADHPCDIWHQSNVRKDLIGQLKAISLDHEVEDCKQPMDIQENGVTEIIITQVPQEMEASYRDWIAKIHQIEARFPGFRGVYVQAPNQGQGRNWITLLHFDTEHNLEKWLDSSERAELMKESKALISSMERHRMTSSYSGWFASLGKEGGIPPVWKQTMIVLLVLFPIVMLQIKYLEPLRGYLNESLRMFFANALSVSMIAWIAMPLAVWFLGWWLVPKTNRSWRSSLIGTLTVIALYILEIFLFWQ